MHTLEDVIKATCQARFDNQEFLTKTIMPLAEKHAQKILTTLLPQLEVLGFCALSNKAMKERTAELEQILFKALVLRGKMQSATDVYTGTWYKAGDQVNRATMVELRKGEGPQEVAWSVSGLFKVFEGSQSKYEVVCEAKVYSRPQ